MSSSPKSTTQVTKTEPDPARQPHYNDIYDQGRQLYYGYVPEYYPGEGVAGFNPNQIAAQQGQLDYATQVAPQQVQQMQQAQSFGLGNVLNPDNNQYLQSAAQGAIRPVFQQLGEDVLPQLRSGAMDSGQYGSSRQGIAEGLAVDRATQTAMDKTAGMYSDAYSRGLDTFDKTLAQSPALMAAGNMPNEMVGQVGQQQQAYEQALIQDAVQRWMYQQNLPWDQLARYENVIGGGSGQSVSAPGPSGPSQLAGGLGGAAAGGSLGGMLGGATQGSTYGLWGTAIGGILGALANR